jgi:hypothetical protein
VRGPAPFRISAVQGSDAQLAVQADSQTQQVQELTLTLRPQHPGDFERLLRLATDLPGRPEVALRVRARATPRATQEPLADR